MRLGAHFKNEGVCEFTVWAPLRTVVAIRLVRPEERIIPMEKDSRGYWSASVRDIIAGARYFYRLEHERNGPDRPDPASQCQPEGVHGPSQVVDHSCFHWEDDEWKGVKLSKMVIYELHVGAFTAEGTFDAVIPRLAEIRELGINAIELMPVAQFPGIRNWGYDGAYPFAVQNSYGGPEGLKRLVNECHKLEISVILDVVYNHLGPEGNYLWDYAPYFTDKYKTPWGNAINFDDEYSNGVRNFFIENALHWFQNYHIDALRLDAVHGIFDRSAIPFLQELAQSVEKFSAGRNRTFCLTAESDLNDSRIIRPREQGGDALHAQWCDDFHHSVHALLTGEKDGYYIDFGKMEHLMKTMREGFVYSGGYSEFRKRNHGNSSIDRPAEQFIVFSQNHDQTGNRAFGERLSTLASFESLKLAAGLVLLSPYIPLLFMGEEYGEEAPFLYFVSHGDPDLVEAVRKGRKEEFRSFRWKEEPPDPQSEEAFLNSKIHWSKRNIGTHRILKDFYRQIIFLRRDVPALSNLDKKALEVTASGETLIVKRWKGTDRILCIFNIADRDTNVKIRLPRGEWNKLLDSSDMRWSGAGTFLPERVKGTHRTILRGRSFALFQREYSHAE
ncbi:MAG: malto-oligosyltrehalose trehalohydrolase [Nitrospirota bacterium]